MLYFNPADAMTPGYFPVNIFYRMQTYCMGCRHLTNLLDAHYLCMRCTLLYSFWPCTGVQGGAMCNPCKNYTDAVRTRAAEQWAKLYSDTEGLNGKKLLLSENGYHCILLPSLMLACI